MKKSTLLFLFLALSTSLSVHTLHAQSGWFPLKTAPNARQFFSITFINADTGFVCTLDSGNYRTTDGGKTWTSLPTLYGVHFKFFNNNKLGYCFGGLFKTTDGGFNWVYQSLKAIDIDFPTDSVGYLVGFSSDTLSITIGKSLDGGESWSYTRVPVLEKNTKQRVVRLRYIAFRDADHGFVALDGEAQDGSGGGAGNFYTSDGGSTWKALGPVGDQMFFLHDSTWIEGVFGYESPVKTNNDFNGPNHYLDSIVDLDSSKYYCRHNHAYALSKCDTNNILGMNVYSGAGEITRSTDAGESWHIQLCFSDAPLNDIRASVSLPTKLVGYAVGVDSQIYKTIDGGGLSFHNDVKKVDQNSTLVITPNPTTGIISISGVSENILSVTVENILGKTIAEFTHPESPSLKLDLSQQPPGTYFARFVTAEAVVVRKITLK
jgi:photosystem II stability/assembly factor-like uncharacterized protein